MQIFTLKLLLQFISVLTDATAKVTAGVLSFATNYIYFDGYNNARALNPYPVPAFTKAQVSSPAANENIIA